MLTDHLPRVRLAHLPTPLEEMPRLRRALGGGPRLLIKRDDATGLATGGNKTRKLEFLVGDALARGARTLVTEGGPQSNHCRQTAAAAARLGLRCVLVIGGRTVPRSAWNGNLLLNDLLGAEMVWAGEQERAAAMRDTCAELDRQGARPYVIPVGGSVPTGAAGYVAAMEELAGQLASCGERVDRIVFPSGSAGTHAGLLVGAKALDLHVRIEGVCDDKIGDLLTRLKSLTRETASFLGLDLGFSDEDFFLHYSRVEHAYGVITDSEREALRLLARTEGIIADPIYTARALAELFERVREGSYRTGETVVFWHTGGVAGIFARPGEVLG